MNILNLSGATSFWVSTSIWESLLNAKHFIFLHVHAWALLESLVRTIKKLFFENFVAFFYCFRQFLNACASICSLVKIHNSYRHTFFKFLCTKSAHVWTLVSQFYSTMMIIIPDINKWHCTNIKIEQKKIKGVSGSPVVFTWSVLKTFFWVVSFLVDYFHLLHDGRFAALTSSCKFRMMR